MSKWVEHIKDFAKRNNLTYGCALSDPKCSEEYRIKNPKPVKAVKGKKGKKLDLSKTEFVPLEEAIPDTEPKTKMVVAKKSPAPPAPEPKPEPVAKAPRNKIQKYMFIADMKKVDKYLDKNYNKEFDQVFLDDVMAKGKSSDPNAKFYNKQQFNEVLYGFFKMPNKLANKMEQLGLGKIVEKSGSSGSGLPVKQMGRGMPLDRDMVMKLVGEGMKC